jgi:hypothetical protein
MWDIISKEAISYSYLLNKDIKNDILVKKDAWSHNTNIFMTKMNFIFIQ